MIGVYFSGTGNTKYCLEKFISCYDGNIEAVSIESPRTAEKIVTHKEIIFAYPIYYSSLPKIVRDLIERKPEIWQGKRIFLIATMALFSGDGSGVSARLFQKYGASILGGLHLRMPDSICDVKALKRPPAKNKQIIEHTEKKIATAANRLQNGTPPKDGLGCFAQLAGLFGQRLLFSHMTNHYSDRLRIHANACTGCGACVSLCPMQNLTLLHNKAVSKNHCTLCYRCANQCPQKAITILGRQVVATNSSVPPPDVPPA